MKYILLALTLAFTLITQASDETFTKTTKSLDRLIHAQEKTEEARLKRELIQLQNELRSANRAYYLLSKEHDELKAQLESLQQSEAYAPAEGMYTEEQVAEIVQNAQNEIWADSMVYRIAEREFLLSLSSIVHGKFVVEDMLASDYANLRSIYGEDFDFSSHVGVAVEEYREYFEARFLRGEELQKETNRILSAMCTVGPQPEEPKIGNE
jgi:hypothetical protein